MEVLWKEGDVTAKHISEVLGTQIGWNKNTTYTVIKKCMAKNAVQRIEPHFVCHALIDKKEVQHEETQELIDRIYEGSVDNMFAAMIDSRQLTEDQIRNLKKLVEELG